MAIYAIVVFFATIVGFTAALLDYNLGATVAWSFVGIWGAVGVIIAAPTIVDRGRPGKLDDLLKYLLTAIAMGPFLLTGMADYD